MDPFQDESQSGGFDPMTLLRAFWRRKLLFFVPFILCLAMAAVAIKTMTPIYASSGQIMIKFEGLNSRLLTDPSRRFGRPKYIDTVAYQEMDLLLTSPEFLEKMARGLGLPEAEHELSAESGPISEEQAVRRARNRLASTVKLKQDGARLFALEVRHTNPEEAYRRAKFILERFVEEYRATQTSSNTSTREFLQEQLDVYRAERERAEKALTDFQASLASESLIDNPVNAGNIGYAQTNLSALRDRYEGADAREMADLDREVQLQLGEVPQTVPYMSDETVRVTIQEMEQLGAELMLYPTGTSETRDLDTRLGQLRVRLNSRIEQMVAGSYPQLGFLARNQISHFVYFRLFREGAKRVIDRVTEDIAEFRDFTSRRPGQSARITELQEDVDTARNLVNNIEKEITTQTLNLEASMSELGMQVRVRRVPHLSYAPVEPNKMKLMALGVILSLGIGLGLVVLAIFLDRSFKTVEEIERTLGLSVIGTLPMIQDDHFERRRKVRVLRWATIILGIIAVGAVGFLVIYPRLG